MLLWLTVALAWAAEDWVDIPAFEAAPDVLLQAASATKTTLRSNRVQPEGGIKIEM